MSATVATALKKIALAIVTEPETLKKVLCIVLSVVVGLLMSVVAVVYFFSGNIELDTSGIKETVISSLTAEEQAKLQFVEDTMYNIDLAMTNAGHSENQIKEAQILYVLGLSDYAKQDDFVSKLTACFSNNKTDEQLILKVNSTFGTNLSVDDFSNVMNGIRSVYIDTSGYVDTTTKNNLDLVTWAKNAADNHWGYVYGTYGTVLDKTMLEFKAEQYPDMVGNNVDFITDNWLGKRTADCVGLIKGYSWYDTENKKTVIGSNNMHDIGADKMFENATEKGTIDTLPEIPGLAVWHEGHIGIYIGNGEVVQAANTQAGVIRTRVSSNAWTHWLKIPYIEYLEQEENI